jgi:hypothetical protein
VNGGLGFGAADRHDVLGEEGRIVHLAAGLQRVQISHSDLEVDLQTMERTGLQNNNNTYETISSIETMLPAAQDTRALRWCICQSTPSVEKLYEPAWASLHASMVLAF